MACDAAYFTVRCPCGHETQVTLDDGVPQPDGRLRVPLPDHGCGRKDRAVAFVIDPGPWPGYVYPHAPTEPAAG